MSKLKLHGSFVALVTPMTDSGEVDYQDLNNLLDFHLNNKTRGIVLLGTTGEAATLTEQEKEKLVKQAVTRINRKIPLIVGTGHNATSQTIRQTQQAKDWGADAALVVTPYYNKPTQAGLVAHYAAVAQSVDLPIILYNVPGRTACDMLPTTVATLAKQHPNIIGLKEAVDDEARIKELVAVCPKDFSLLSGDDASFVNFIRIGGHGTVSVTANIVPDRISDICSAALQSDWQTAEKINHNLLQVHEKLFISSNPVPAKWALFYLGLIKSAACRLPLLELEQQYYEQVIAALQHAEIEKLLNAS